MRINNHIFTFLILQSLHQLLNLKLCLFNSNWIAFNHYFIRESITSI
ncbi:unnamed protein product [Schistosoma curassoni]|uniref:Uncharacterized protein n=1 Tax=Schistosoma curassoni TaxID=6186 RepID=A0A183KYI1_9TREM|nr:unnamed protein product [Schistosoma curassoni]